jgi:metallo-beta-lactamase family protein
MRIKFLGAAGTVTGSRYLVESNSGKKILIDCGLFQGLKNLRLKNWAEFPIDPKIIDAVVLTHAHIDHSGYLPKLVQQGFNGLVFCTTATKALAQILLEDCSRIIKEEADYANEKAYSKHKPAKSLYELEDVKAAISNIRVRKLEENFVFEDFKFQFFEAGHILGAVSVLIEADGRKLLFSGDLGKENDLLEFNPSPAADADYVVIESTYGDRLHPDIDPVLAMADLIKRVIAQKSVLIIPSFAVGRAQMLIYCIYKVFYELGVKSIPVYLNSPMASSVTQVYDHYVNSFKLTKEEFQKVCSMVNFVETVNDSKALNKKSGPMIIISASGMLTGGRVLHHLSAFGHDPNNILLLAGFQAPGTRGADIARGEKSIKYFGEYHEISAELVKFDFLSAHADQAGLLKWLGSMKTKPNKVFISHGEPQSADFLRRKINEELQIDALVAQESEEFLLD